MVININSVQKQQGNILKNRELVLYVNGRLHYEFLSHKERVFCLKNALRDFDSELEDAAERFKNHPYGAYLWLYTSDFIRGEEIKLLFRKHYLLKIIEYLIEQHPVKKVIFNTPAGPFIKKRLIALGIQFKCNYTQWLISGTVHLLIGLKRLFFTTRFNLKCLFSKANPGFNGVLIDVSSRIKKNRYDNLGQIVQLHEKVKFYSGDQLDVTGTEKEKTVVFKREMDISIIAAALMKSIRLTIFIFRNKKLIPEGLYYNHRSLYNLLLYSDIILAEKCIAKYLDKSNIKTIVQVSTLTKPIYRLLISAAKQRGIEFILVASRSLGPYENAEHLLRCDVKGYNNTHLPDWYIFKDFYSAEKVFQRFKHLKEKVLIGGRFVSKHIQTDEINKETALLILFNHRKDLSFKLLKEVQKSGLNKLVKKVIIRCHPIFRFERKTIEEHFPDNEIIDITGMDYGLATQYRVIAISGPTTAALEAVQNRLLILWVPYIWDDSVVIDDVMQSVGIINETNKELVQNTETFLTNPDFYFAQLSKDIRYCEQYFNTAELISDKLRYLKDSSNAD